MVVFAWAVLMQCDRVLTCAAGGAGTMCRRRSPLWSRWVTGWTLVGTGGCVQHGPWLPCMHHHAAEADHTLLGGCRSVGLSLWLGGKERGNALLLHAARPGTLRCAFLAHSVSQEEKRRSQAVWHRLWADGLEDSLTDLNTIQKLGKPVIGKLRCLEAHCSPSL